MADRLLVDSGSFREDGAKRLTGLAAVTARGRPVTVDIGWMRLTLWRELLAGLFDHPLLLRELEHVRTLRIDVSRPGDTLRVTKAAWFAGWLAWMLGWELKEPLETRRGSDAMTGTFRSGRHDVKVELRPVRSADGVRSAGSLTRIELGLGRGQNDITARVTRQADHLLATATWNGAEVSRRAGQLEPFGEAPYLAEALHGSGTDPVFEGALARATRLLGG
jgi:glucose-6-phosphate dehydrogenase assembly protein OpcA